MIVRFPVCRSQSLVAAGLAACLMLLAPLARAADPLTVKLGYYASSASSIPTYVAAAKGIFAKHGLNVELVLFASGSAAGTALLANGIDAAPLGIEEIAPMTARGEPVKAILGNWAIVGESIMGRADLSWPRAKAGYPAVMQDLKGKTIGITGPNSLTDYTLKNLLAGAGMLPSDVNSVAVGGPANALAAFNAKQIDAYLASEPLGSHMEISKLGVRLIDVGAGEGPAVLQDYTANCVTAKVAWVKSHPEEARRLAAAFVEAHRYIRDFKQHVNTDVKDLANYFPGIAEATLSDTLLRVANWYNPIITPKQVANVNQVLLGFKILKAPIAFLDAVDTSYMPKVFP